MLLHEPKIRRWTKREYYQAGELGWFEGQRVELIDGEVIEMAPQKDEHATAVMLADYALRKAIGKGFVVRVQLPLNCGPASEPEPDLAVVPGPLRSVTRHPTTATLVIEIADTTLRTDRGRKARLYARCGVKDYWIVNLVDRQLEVRRQPFADSKKPFGHDYAETLVLHSGEALAPLAMPNRKVKVKDLLP